MVIFRFRSQSSGESYVLEAALRPSGGFRLSCSCVAGEFGQFCKHKLALMAGDYRDLVDGNDLDIASFKSMMNGTTVPEMLNQLVETEEAIRVGQSRLKKIKADVAKAIRW